jgi:hypothetical protein
VTSFSFTAEQIKSAPPEVRRWFEREIAATFRELATQRPEPRHAPELAACAPEEAFGVFEAIRNDFAAAQVFLELGREPPIGNSPAGLHALGVADIKRNLRLGDDRLADAFGVIGRSFMQLRGDSAAVLFGFDQANHVYLHEVTHRSIRSLWETLVELQQPETPAAPTTSPPATVGFVPPT